MMPELHQICRKDEENHTSMYLKHSDDLEELMKLDLDLEEVDRAWTAGNPDT